MAKISRRKLFSYLGSGIVGLSALGSCARPGFAASEEGRDSSEPKIVKYNELGKTGLSVSDVSFGGSDVFSENVVRYAYDLGVNLFDTAERYADGKSEEYIGRALKGVRDKAVIITKYGIDRPRVEKFEDLSERVEKSLKRFQTDYLDMMFFHGLNDPRVLEYDMLMQSVERLKREGKIRFSGFSTHNASDMLAACIKPQYAQFAQVVLFFFNHIDGVKIAPLVNKVHDAGIGTIAMKTQAGGKQGNLRSFVNKNQTYEVAALKWVLSHESIDSTVISMKTYSHVEAYIRASGKRLDDGDHGMLKDYRRKVDTLYCRLDCNACESSCPNDVAISDIMRYAMYYEDYRQEKVAIQAYARLNPRHKPHSCYTCAGFCNSACPYRLQVKEKLLHTHSILA